TLPSIYQKTNRFLFFISFIMLGFYYPLTYIIDHWFPDYHAVIQYFPLFLIMTMMQGKEHFLHTVYLKALRQESRLLLYNTIFSILAAAVVIPVYFMTRSVYAVALATCILIIFKSYSFEIYIRTKQLHLKIRNIEFEVLLIVLYALATIFMDRYYSLALYVTVAIVYSVLLYKFIISYLKRLYKEFRHK
ncbi:MAG: hypothetical protein K9G42_13475, partial [Pedobacter sp.]|nr:hypothetical protein [Pedobacter sp.]